MKKPILCIDFDGVIHSYTSGWKGARCIPDPSVPGAINFLIHALEVFDVHIYSSRSRYFGGRRAMKRWLRAQLIDYYWPSLPCVIKDFDQVLHLWAYAIISAIKFPLMKPAAFLQIDDRAITFTGTFPDIQDLLKFRPWNKKGGQP